MSTEARLGQDATQVGSSTIAEDLASFTARLDYEMIPDSAIHFAKALVVKTVAASLGGSGSPSAAAFAAHVNERGLPQEVGAIGFDFRTALWEGVLLNIFTGHNSELEDVAHSPGGVSWDITVIPLVLALGEKLHLSGRSALEAIVAGLEVHYRTCLPFDATGVGMVLPPTAAMGCAASAAKAYGLAADQTTAALGFGLSSAPMAEVSMGTDAHFFESALHGLQGVVGAEMAALGLTGNPDLNGFIGLGATDVPIEEARRDLSERWFFEEMWIKKYPVCFLIHRQLDALLEIQAEHGISYGDIETIEVHTGPGEASCDRPEPKTIGDLQFSFQHTLGAAAIDRGLGLEHVALEAATNPRFVEARQKVEVFIDESVPFSVSLAEPMTVVVRTTDGRVFERERLTARGSPDEPLTDEQFSELYRAFVGTKVSPDARELTLKLIWSLEDLDDVAELMEALTFVKQA